MTLVLGTLKLLVLHSWRAGPHQVVEEHACCDHELDGLGLLLHRAQENLEHIDKDAEGIFYNYPGSGLPVVQDALWPRHTPEAVRLHRVGSYGKGIVADDKIGHIQVVVGERFWIREA